jgi:putative ABC transport system permease protein
VIVGQVALGIVLTAGAGLLISSFAKLTHQEIGFHPDHLLTFRFETPDARYKTTRPQFYREYFERLRAMPGVQAAAGTLILPMTDDGADITFENPEHPMPKATLPSADISLISGDYFKTMQTPLLKGRDFNDADTVDSPKVMIVNQAFAEKFFAGEEALGKKLKPGVDGGLPGGPPPREIVGIVGNMHGSMTQRRERPAYYLPASQLPDWCCLVSVVRTSLDPHGLEPTVRQLVTSMDKDIPITDVRTMPELMSLQLSQPRFAMVLLGAFAGLAFGIAADARDRRAAGAGRAAGHGAADDPARCRGAAGERHRGWTGRGAGFGLSAQDDALRNGIARSVGACRGLPGGGLHWHAGCLSTCSARLGVRTDAGAAHGLTGLCRAVILAAHPPG